MFSTPNEQDARGTAKMRQSEFGWHDDHLMKNLAVALALAVIGASVVDSLIGAVTPLQRLPQIDLRGSEG